MPPGAGGGSGIGGEGQRAGTIGFNAVVKLKKISKQIKAKARSLAELRARQEAEMEELDNAERTERLAVLRDVPFGEDVAAENGLVHELATLRQLHARELAAIETLCGLRQEIAVARVKDAHAAFVAMVLTTPRAC